MMLKEKRKREEMKKGDKSEGKEGRVRTKGLGPL
jgi:hypothetical protein